MGLGLGLRLGCESEGVGLGCELTVDFVESAQLLGYNLLHVLYHLAPTELRRDNGVVRRQMTVHAGHHPREARSVGARWRMVHIRSKDDRRSLLVRVRVRGRLGLGLGLESGLGPRPK